MTYDADVLILGGGCAGLSLATALAEQHSDLRVQILEARTTYVRDRTWCLWNTEPHPFQHCVTHRWHSWAPALYRVAHTYTHTCLRSRHGSTNEVSTRDGIRARPIFLHSFLCEGSSHD